MITAALKISSRYENTALIESELGFNAHEICNIDTDTVPVTSGMFVLREIYDTLIEKLVGEDGKKMDGKYDCGSIGKARQYIEEWQEKLQKAEYDLITGKLCKINHAKLPEEKRNPKITPELQAKMDKMVDEMIERIKAEKSAPERQPLQSKDYPQMTEEEVESVKEDCKARFKELVIKKTQTEETDENDDYVFYSHCLDASLFRDYEAFCNLYFMAIKDGKLHEELAEFAIFIRGMVAVNTFFFPACNGYQHGNDYMSNILYKKAAQVTNKRIKKHKEMLAEEEA